MTAPAGDTSQPPFRFPLRSPAWPVRDPDAGVAFPKGGMHGAFHAGVVHAFVLSGYLPSQVGGSSMGAYAATTLAIASDLDDQASRLKLVEELVAVWQTNPGRHYYTAAWNDSPLRRLLDESARIPLPTETLGRLVWHIFRGPRWKKALAAIRLWFGGIPQTRRGLEVRWRTLVASVRGGLDLLGGHDAAFALRVAQAVLDAYGMHASLLPIDPGDAGFNALFERWLPLREGRKPSLDDLKNTRFTLQLTNLRWAREAASARAGDRRSPVLVVRDGDGADFLTALKAAVSLQPMHAPFTASQVFPRYLPDGVEPDDPLVDSSYVSHLPIDRLVDRWRGDPVGDRVRPKRLFAVFSDPLEGAPSRDEGFFGHAVHDLYLLAQRDQLYDLQVTRLITELLRAAPRADGSMLMVDPEPIAPGAMLGFQPVSVPDDRLVDAALGHGCRAAMQVLHKETLTSMGVAPGGTVACAALRALLRARSDAPAGFFEPSARICALCTGQLQVPVPPPTPATPPLRETDRLGRLTAGPPPPDRPALVVVPAGGAFLGVFHVGALVALHEHGVHPDIYAGASVGTMFSMLMHGGLGPGRRVSPELITRMLDVDQWADHDDHAPPGGPVGRVDRLLALLQARLASPDVQDLLAMPPGRIVNTLNGRLGQGAPELERVRKGLAGLLFGPVDAPHGSDRAPYPDAPPLPGLSPQESGELASNALRALLAGDLPALFRFGDLVAQHFGVVRDGFPHDGELIGFDRTSRLLRLFLFDGKEPPTLAAHAGQSAHFLFTVTNHTTGRLEHFGGAPGDDADAPPGADSPNALQAVLAGSSLPLAFRRRTRAEVFGRADGPKEDRFTDGGIFNNFPVDSAIKYLRHLSQYEEYAWLADHDVRIILLPLQFPAPPEAAGGAADGCLRGAVDSRRQAEHQKLRRVLRQQEQVHGLARDANAALSKRREGGIGPRLAILSDFDLVAPARKVYPSPFSFKPWLGFSTDKQAELLAQGCRRARYSLLFRSWREARASGRDELETFDAEVRTEQKHARNTSEHACVFGAMYPRPCAFLAIDPATGARISKVCAATASKDLPAAQLPMTNRADVWARLRHR